MTAVPKSRILGTGHYTPARVVSNFDLEKVVDTSDAWIAERTGIRRRHYAADDEVTSDMAAAAARQALEAAGLNVADLDMIIVGTISGDTPMPVCAVHVQQKLGADGIPAFDISAACAGFVYGLTIADQFIATGAASCVLIIGVELLSRLMNWQDRTTCVLFGDGAGAVVLGPAKDDGRGILSTKIFTDGSLAGALHIPGGGSAEPLTPAGPEEQAALDKAAAGGGDAPVQVGDGTIVPGAANAARNAIPASLLAVLILLGLAALAAAVPPVRRRVHARRLA